MPELSPDLFQRWYHSFEEDTDDEAVYRPADFPFPPRRAPRDSLEFRPGGGYIEYVAGPADKSAPSRGSWEAADGDTVRVRAGAGPRLLHITAHDGQVLKIRK
ncbi:hypothetical protein Ade02nite_43430 [Paractinoplanes deccanensis]|uniref:NfeD-like C-terminal domain-containing protein n=1 Tax=Paractinoplanes deccanensis TaxID=113561 RepID=A0ABQ3Y6S8_9ACTN|nr:hypothetical protein [Actinoplanes deccanensis]GID75702.1 hypothetical protein Ade02nite_43430 [Actinoplanes deccanensis]